MKPFLIVIFILSMLLYGCGKPPVKHTSNKTSHESNTTPESKRVNEKLEYYVVGEYYGTGDSIKITDWGCVVYSENDSIVYIHTPIRIRYRYK